MDPVHPISVASQRKLLNSLRSDPKSTLSRYPSLEGLGKAVADALPPTSSAFDTPISISSSIDSKSNYLMTTMNVQPATIMSEVISNLSAGVLEFVRSANVNDQQHKSKLLQLLDMSWPYRHFDTKRRNPTSDPRITSLAFFCDECLLSLRPMNTPLEILASLSDAAEVRVLTRIDYGETRKASKTGTNVDNKNAPIIPHLWIKHVFEHAIAGDEVSGTERWLAFLNKVCDGFFYVDNLEDGDDTKSAAMGRQLLKPSQLAFSNLSCTVINCSIQTSATTFNFLLPRHGSIGFGFSAIRRMFEAGGVGATYENLGELAKEVKNAGKVGLGVDKKVDYNLWLLQIIALVRTIVCKSEGIQIGEEVVDGGTLLREKRKRDAEIRRAKDRIRQKRRKNEGAVDDEFNEDIVFEDDAEDSGEERERKRQQDMGHTIATVARTAIRQLIKLDKTKLFLNPVTDDVAPGYSSVIAKPISLTDMKKMRWQSLAHFAQDVNRMYTNCEEYNVGEGGKWFREEARRQRASFKPILKEAKDLLEKAAKARGERQKVVVTKKTKRSSGNSSSAANAANSVLVDDDSSNCDVETGTIPTIPPRTVTGPPDSPNTILLASIIVSTPAVTNRLLLNIYNTLRTKILEPSMKHETTGKTPPPILPVQSDNELQQLLQLLVFAYDSRAMCGGGGRTYWVRGGRSELGLSREIASFLGVMARCEIIRRLGEGGEYFDACQDVIAEEFDLMNDGGVEIRSGDPTFSRIVNDLSLVLLGDLAKTAKGDDSSEIFEKQLCKIRSNLSGYGDGHGLLFDRVITGTMETGFPTEGKNAVCTLFEEWVSVGGGIDSVCHEKYLALLLRFGRKKSYKMSFIQNRVERLLDIVSPSGDESGGESLFSLEWNRMTKQKQKAKEENEGGGGGGWDCYNGHGEEKYQANRESVFRHSGSI